MSKSRFILFNPSSPLPPKKVWESFEKAKSTAEWAAKQNPGEQYLVCEVRNVTVIKDSEVKSIDVKAYDNK